MWPKFQDEHSLKKITKMFTNSHSFDKNVPCRSTTPIDGNMRSRKISKLVDHTGIYLYEIHYINICKQVLPFKELMVF